MMMTACERYQWAFSFLDAQGIHGTDSRRVESGDSGQMGVRILSWTDSIISVWPPRVRK